MLMKTFVYRLYPTKQQQALLRRQLEECRWLWNTLLAERKQAREERQEAVDYYEQKAELPILKERERPSLAEVHSQVLQDVVLRLKRAFDAYFRRLEAGETPGYPRFRGQGRFASLTYPQWGNGVLLTGAGDRLRLSKVGTVKLVLHRSLEGTPKTATIRRTATGKWYVSITCECESRPLPPTNCSVGIDLGLITFATCSDGYTIPTPRFLRAEEQALNRAHRRLSASLETHARAHEAAITLARTQHPEWGVEQVRSAVRQYPEERAAWQERERRRQVLARIYERIHWRRTDFSHQHSRRLVNTYDLLVLEDLTISPLVQSGRLAKSILDAAWRQFSTHLSHKAACAGRRMVVVNPAFTSQDCSNCGARKVDLVLTDRTYACPRCGLSLDRDLNAARNILSVGQHALA